MKALHIQVLKEMAASNRLGAKEQFDIAKTLENKRKLVAEQCLANARRYELQAEAVEALLSECSEKEGT